MKFSRPLVLLLGGILSASSLGCAAITAVVSDSRPAHRENRSDADRLVAIGRVFENQGRYDRAEVLYRKAQKLNPQDASIRSQLQQLAARRKEKQFGPSGAAEAIALADAVRPPEHKAALRQTADVSKTGERSLVAATVQPAAPTVKPTAASVETAAYLPVVATRQSDALPKAAVATAAHAATPEETRAVPPTADIKEIAVPLIQAKAISETDSQTVTAMTNSVFEKSSSGQWKAADQGFAEDDFPEVAFAENIVTRPDLDDAPGQHSAPQIKIEPQITRLSASTEGSPENVRDRVTTEGVMVALECPEQHVELLLAALANGADTETRSLAATLLGDCDPGNVKVRDALNHQHELQSPPALLLAVCDSQIERGESSQATVNSLIRLCTKFSRETQIQAVAQLRNFSGTRYESLCVGTLSGLLSDDEPSVRAAAAVTLGDFSGLDSEIIERLRELTANGANQNVREAAELALARQ